MREVTLTPFSCAVLASLAAVPLAYLLQPGGTLEPSTAPLALLGITSTLFGAAVFLRQGGRVITPSATYFLFTAVFCGLGPLMLIRYGTHVPAGVATDAAATALLANVTTWIVWRRAAAGSRISTPQEWTRIAVERHRIVLVAGLGLMFAGLVTTRYDYGTLGALLGPVPRAAAYAGVILVAVAGALTPTRLRGLNAGLARGTAALTLLLYVRLFFGGGGRLVVAGLALGVAAAANMAAPRRWHKVAILAAVIPGLLLAGWYRADRHDEETTVEQVAGEGAGLGSVYSPIETFAELIHRDRTDGAAPFPRRHGRTFAESAVTWVPGQLWPGKPEGFGAQLTAVLRPEMAHTTHSMAALAHGEWFVNFWWLGLPMMAVAGGWVLARLDGWQATLMRRDRVGLRTLWATATSLLVLAGIGDYLWVGTFTFMARNAVSIALVAVLWRATVRRTSGAGDSSRLPRSAAARPTRPADLAAD